MHSTSTLLYSTPFVLLEEVHREIWPRAAARKNPGPARRKMKHHSPENHFTVPRGPRVERSTPLPGKSFHRSAWSARRKVNTTPFPPKRPKSPTGHPRALGKVPQSIPQWMFSESISDAFHPGDFPIPPRITRGRSTAAPCQPAEKIQGPRVER